MHGYLSQGMVICHVYGDLSQSMVICHMPGTA